MWCLVLASLALPLGYVVWMVAHHGCEGECLLADDDEAEAFGLRGDEPSVRHLLLSPFYSVSFAFVLILYPPYNPAPKLIFIHWRKVRLISPHKNSPVSNAFWPFGHAPKGL